MSNPRHVLLLLAAVVRAAPPSPPAVNSLGMAFVRVPAGTFLMGADEAAEPYDDGDLPRHRVVLSQPFLLGRSKVTRAQWAALMGPHPLGGEGDPDLPVNYISWPEAQAFVERLNRKEGTRTYRLPTEAEWEYACRAGVAGRLKASSEVNPWGLEGMQSGLNEWCQDFYDEHWYARSPVLDPKGPAEWGLRACRGLAYLGESFVFRASSRFNEGKPNLALDYNGFRIARTLPAEPVPPMGHLRVTANVPGARVLLGGRPEGALSPAGELKAMHLPAGPVAVRVEAPGRRPAAGTFVVPAGAWARADLNLERAPAPEPGIAYRNAAGLAFVRIPAGAFTMGSDPWAWKAEEAPRHQVTISRPFLLQQTPVTVGQFKAFVAATGFRASSEVGGGQSLTGRTWQVAREVTWRTPAFDQEDACPVVCVSWEDARAFIGWLNRMDPGRGYRLPTEAEWEYACRAGSQEIRYGELEDIAWFQRNAGSRTRPVAGKEPNAWGLFDMLGNAGQWCQDWYAARYYAGSPAADPVKADPPRGVGEYKVVRGGCFRDRAEGVRASARRAQSWNLPNHTIGFRVAADAP